MLGFPKSSEIFSDKLQNGVRELASLPGNLIIKQAPWSSEYESVIKNIEDMRKLHEGKYGNLYYIEPENAEVMERKMSSRYMPANMWS